MDNAKEFRERYKVSKDYSIENFIKQEQIRIRIDKNLSDRQKRERLEALETLLNDLHDSNSIKQIIENLEK